MMKTRMKCHITELKVQFSSMEAWKIPKEPSSLAPAGIPSSKGRELSLLLINNICITNKLAKILIQLALSYRPGRDLIL